MSYLDIVVTAVYPDRLDADDEVGRKRVIDGAWNVEVVVVGTNLEPEEFRRLLADAAVLRVEVGGSGSGGSSAVGPSK